VHLVRRADPVDLIRLTGVVRAVEELVERDLDSGRSHADLPADFGPELSFSVKVPNAPEHPDGLGWERTG
jgi:hypothetical protein